MGINLILLILEKNSSFLLNYAGMWFAMISLHILGILYFGFVFREGPRGWIIAGVMSAIGVGVGQAYNRQVKKAIVYLCVYLFGMFILQQDVLDEILISLIILSIVLCSMFDAGFGAAESGQRWQIKSRWNEIKSNAPPDYSGKYDLAIDTNILTGETDLLEYLLEEETMDLYVSMVVFNELEELHTGQIAHDAFAIIEDFQREKRLHFLKTPNTHAIGKYKLDESTDYEKICTYLHQLNTGHNKLLFLSNDKVARIIARSIDMPTAEM